MQRKRGEPTACDSPSLSRYFLEQKFMGRAIAIVCNKRGYTYSFIVHRNAIAIGDNSRHDHFTGNIVNTKASFFTCCRYNHQAVALFNNLNSSCRTDRLDTARSVDFPQKSREAVGPYPPRISRQIGIKFSNHIGSFHFFLRNSGHTGLLAQRLTAGERFDIVTIGSRRFFQFCTNGAFTGQERRTDFRLDGTDSITVVDCGLLGPTNNTSHPIGRWARNCSRRITVLNFR